MQLFHVSPNVPRINNVNTGTVHSQYLGSMIPLTVDCTIKNKGT